MKFVLTCGGTAGHINPAIAVAQRLRELLPDCEILFLGAEGKMEMDLVPRDGFPIRPLRVTNLSRGHHLADVGHNIATMKNVIESGHEARRILKEFRPDAVLGTGGYVCYPVLHEASKLGIPTLVHESNAIPGLTTKMLSNSVSCVLLGYEESREPGWRLERADGVIRYGVLTHGSQPPGKTGHALIQYIRTCIGVPQHE